MKNRESIATRALVTVLAGMLVVSTASMLAFYVVQKQRYDDKTVEAGKALLSGLDHESAESIEKGQRATFQAVLDSFAKIDAIEYAALYSPAGLMTYRSGQVSVGMPFVHEDGEFKNPNLELYQESDGRYARADWEMVNHVDSERALEHVKEKRQKKEQCIDCHFSVSKDLAFDDDQMAWILADEAPVFFHRIDATADCLTCHTNWKAGETAGYLSVQMDTTAEQAAFQGALTGVGFTVMALVATIALLILRVFSSRIKGPIVAVAEVFERARTERDLGLRGDDSRPDEIGAMAKSFNFLMGAMRSMLKDVKDISGVLLGASGSLRDAFSRLSAGMRVTRSRTEEASETLGSMAADIREVAGLAVEANTNVGTVASDTEAIAAATTGLASEADDVANNMTQVAVAVEEMNAALTEVSRSGERVAVASAETQQRRAEAQSRLEELAALAAKVAKVVGVIESVADQTSLLALNATIEAAGAGEAGRGFAVVAGEVKTLAGQAAKATDEIRGEVQAMEHAMSEVVVLMRTIGERSEEVNEMTRAIAVAVEEQTSTTAEIAKRVSATATSVNAVSNSVGQIDGRVRAVLANSEMVSSQVALISDRAQRLAESGERVSRDVDDVRKSALSADDDCVSVGSAAEKMQELVGRLESTASQFRA